jgi:signal recognition particle receptor subunit beta
VLADVRRLEDCFPSVSYFETREVPFLVAVNVFDDAPRYDLSEIRQALDLDDSIPLVLCDARDHDSVKQTLIRLVQSLSDSLALTSGRS